MKKLWDITDDWDSHYVVAESITHAISIVNKMNMEDAKIAAKEAEIPEDQLEIPEILSASYLGDVRL
jgi:hypothetical protein